MSNEYRDYLVWVREFMEFLHEHHLLLEDDDPDVDLANVAQVFITEVHDWYRTGRFETEAETFTEYCENIQKENEEADKQLPLFTVTDGFLDPSSLKEK